MVTLSGILAWKYFMDRGAWQATAHQVTRSQTWLSTALPSSGSVALTKHSSQAQPKTLLSPSSSFKRHQYLHYIWSWKFCMEDFIKSLSSKPRKGWGQNRAWGGWNERAGTGQNKLGGAVSNTTDELLCAPWIEQSWQLLWLPGAHMLYAFPTSLASHYSFHPFPGTCPLTSSCTSQSLSPFLKTCTAKDSISPSPAHWLFLSFKHMPPTPTGFSHRLLPLHRLFCKSVTVYPRT